MTIEVLRYASLFTSLSVVVVFASIAYTLMRTGMGQVENPTRRVLIELVVTLAIAAIFSALIYILILFFDLNTVYKDILANVRLLITNSALILIGLAIRRIQQS